MISKSKDMYLFESGNTKSYSDNELQTLFLKLPDDNVCNDIIEGCQNRLIEAASFFETESIYYMDLIQEANLALFMMLMSQDIKDKSSEAGKLIDNTIKNAMLSYCEKENEEQKSAERLTSILNAIDDYCREIAENENREVTSEELANKLSMDENDIKYLMRIALNAINKE